MIKSTNELKDRVFVLTSSTSPLTYVLPSRNTKRFSLLHFDGKTNRALRYARNQKSVFEDEQDDNAIVEPVIFEDGALVVPANNPLLSQFLDIHPLNGQIFTELNPEKEAMTNIEDMNIELDAQIAARNMDLDTMLAVARLVWGPVVDTMTTPELKRDVLLYAREYPIQLLEMLNDPSLTETALASKALSEGLFSMRNNNREIWFNMTGNKRKLMNVQQGEDPIYVLTAYLESAEGKEVLEMVKSKLS
jgi:hypothetical protein